MRNGREIHAHASMSASRILNVSGDFIGDISL
jgi:hypothetical protein